MPTLYQIHTDLSNLKPQVKDLSKQLKAGDGVVLLGESVAYIDWLLNILEDLLCDMSEIDDGSDFEEVADFNETPDGETNDATSQYPTVDKTHLISEVSWYLLEDDLKQLSNDAQKQLTLSLEMISTTDKRISLISDERWVDLSHQFERMITLSN